MRRVTGWIVLGMMWSGVALRIVFPHDLHGVYPVALNILNWVVDLCLFLPPWLLLHALETPPEASWP